MSALEQVHEAIQRQPITTSPRLVERTRLSVLAPRRRSSVWSHSGSSGR